MGSTLRTAVALSSVVLFGTVGRASDTPDPTSVVVAGSLQSELGCPGDWQPECSVTALTFEADDGVWQRTFTVSAGDWEYKAALNGNWDENYGQGAIRNGANIPLSLAGATAVKFYYSHETHWVADSHNQVIAVAPGSFQSELGCPGDWQPDCLRSWLQDPDGDGLYVFRTSALPAGAYEVKVALNESWDVNYGAGGQPNGANIPFTVLADCAETVFTYDSSTHLLTISSGESEGPQPAAVTIAGSLQSELGCPGDWQPDCAGTALAFEADDGVWQRTFNVPAGSWEYKAALNGSWNENYGQNATLNGPNIPLSLAGETAVKFYYSHATHWVADNHTKVIAVAPGSFQSELGCPGDWQPDCLRSWLQDPDGDGLYIFRTSALPAGDYEVKVALNESWDVNYGAGGELNGPNIPFTVPAACREIVFAYDSVSHVLTVGSEGAPRGNLSKARAHWLNASTVAWNLPGVAPDWTVALHYDPAGGLALGPEGVTGGQSIPLTYDPAGLTLELRTAFPHLAGYAAFRVPASRLGEVPAILQGQIAASAADGGGTPVDATSLQIPGVLDDLFAYHGPLGVSFAHGTPTLRLWAPTARSVKLHLFPTAVGETSDSYALTRPVSSGVWSVTGSRSWVGRYYLFEVEVFVRSTGRVERNLVTDPYSVSLSRNSKRSQIIDLDARVHKPSGWDVLRKPTLRSPADIVLYELHVRDFSASDPSVPEALKGTFRAFTVDSHGTRHLRALARAGLTHVHLLPAFDIASVDEDKTQWRNPGDLSVFPPDSESQQAAVAAVANQDAYNWGYDPWHYTVPEGSFAKEVEGSSRIEEFRRMVAGLAHLGLRVVMDVVYNHTTASGQNDKSVLDRVVPGYYHRLNADGDVERSTCCENTASEHQMMEKLLIDSVLTWAREYKVDGFRFDLMGHHMKRNMVKLRAALDALTLQRDGIDGRKVYLYGEGWNFGEVANGARGENAIQRNMAGTGIATFNDRLRDGARGGGPFSGLQEQGFLTGLYNDPNATDQGSAEDQRQRLLLETDWIRIGLAGNLADFTFEDRLGRVVLAKDVDYNGQPAGYTADPQETINYVEAHDNETLFDAIQLKAKVAATITDRGRMQNLGLSLLGFGQGVPFIHAGAELLRSKSLDRNSYNSGDWFNRLDFTYRGNNWGVGLPPAGDNQSSWPVMRPLLGNAALRPMRDDILRARAHLLEVLAIRRSSALFRLRTADDVKERLHFYNTGPSQVPGLIAFDLRDAEGAVDRSYERVVVVLNAAPQEQTLVVPELAGRSLELHPLQRVSADHLVRQSRWAKGVGQFTIPGRTAAVFVDVRRRHHH
jgi:pullulanase